MSKKTENGGVNLTGILLVMFIVLKLAGLIDWSWWWVLSPLWIPLAILIIIAILGLSGLDGYLFFRRKADKNFEGEIKRFREQGNNKKSRFQLKLETLQKEYKEKNDRANQ